MKLTRVARFAVVLSMVITALPCSSVSAEPRRFTAKDDVALALFEYGGQGTPGGVIKYSPDGRYFAVVTERGNLDLKSPEDTIWLFRTDEIRHFMQGATPSFAPTALPLVQMATDPDGPLISGVRWLDDSSGIAFTALKRSARCKYHQLFVVNIRTRELQALTPEDQDIGEFDIRSARRYAYEVTAPLLLGSLPDARESRSTLTGRSLWDVIFPNVEHRVSPFAAAGLWAMVEGNRRQVLDEKAYETPRGGSGLSMAPDGRSVVVILKSEQSLAVWERYKAPPGYAKFNMPLDTSSYHLVDLTNGSKKQLVDAPSGLNQDWNSYFLTARWSADGQSLLLPNTFLPLDLADPTELAARESQPYIAVLRLKTGALRPVLAVKAGLDNERYAVNDVRFENDRTVVVDFDRSHFLPNRPSSAVFRQESDGRWKFVVGAEDPRLSALRINVQKRESINQPPVLIGEDKVRGTTRTIWDPNPQLKDIELGSAAVIYWKDDTGYEWEAGLLLPPDYKPGMRYPLVIQTHGFSKDQFLSNGIFTSSFAGRTLAALGIVVLQIGWNPNNFDTDKEGPDQVAGFESVVKKLVREGMIDPTRVGAIGFSRSVYHVLFAMTAAPQLLAAASVTDGVNFGYFEYNVSVDSGLVRESDLINGGKPFGAEGLRSWLARSPDFHMDSVQTPLLLLQPGARSVLEDWEPYAALRFLNRPVDLIMLQSGTHVMTNPMQRLASETTNVDWFRFWLQNYEDPDTDKTEQYVRWRGLRKLQVDQDAKRGMNGKGRGAVP